MDKKLGKKINKYDLDGNFIETYDSIKIAAKENNMHRSQISNCCNKKYKKAKGYIWRYEDDISN